MTSLKIIGMVIMALQQLSGINAIIFYPEKVLNPTNVPGNESSRIIVAAIAITQVFFY